MNRLQGWYIPILTACLVHGAITMLPINFSHQKEKINTQEITFRLASLPKNSFSPSPAISANEIMFSPKKKPPPPTNVHRRQSTDIRSKSKIQQHLSQEKVTTLEPEYTEKVTTNIASVQPEALSSGSNTMSADPVFLSTELSVICPEFKPPTYPRPSRQLGEYGDVVLKLEVNKNGHIETTQVINSSGYKRLDEAAIEAIKTWRCNPPHQNGQPVRAIALQPFSFVLQ